MELCFPCSFSEVKSIKFKIPDSVSLPLHIIFVLILNPTLCWCIEKCFLKQFPVSGGNLPGISLGKISSYLWIYSFQGQNPHFRRILFLNLISDNKRQYIKYKVYKKKSSTAIIETALPGGELWS